MEGNAGSYEVRFQDESRLTLPEPIVATAGLSEGDRFLVAFDPAEPDIIRLHRIRTTYAGALRDVFADVEDYVAKERATWD